MSALDIMKEHFENDKLRALLLYATCMWGLHPDETGLGLFVPLLLTGAVDKAYLYQRYTPTSSTLAEIHQAGGIIVEAAEVCKINMQNGNVTGVELQSNLTFL